MESIPGVGMFLGIEIAAASHWIPANEKDSRLYGVSQSKGDNSGEYFSSRRHVNWDELHLLETAAKSSKARSRSFSDVEFEIRLSPEKAKALEELKNRIYEENVRKAREKMRRYSAPASHNNMQSPPIRGLSREDLMSRDKSFKTYLKEMPVHRSKSIHGDVQQTRKSKTAREKKRIKTTGDSKRSREDFVTEVNKLSSEVEGCVTDISLPLSIDRLSIHNRDQANSIESPKVKAKSWQSHIPTNSHVTTEAIAGDMTSHNESDQTTAEVLKVAEKNELLGPGVEMYNGVHGKLLPKRWSRDHADTNPPRDHCVHFYDVTMIGSSGEEADDEVTVSKGVRGVEQNPLSPSPPNQEYLPKRRELGKSKSWSLNEQITTDNSIETMETELGLTADIRDLHEYEIAGVTRKVKSFIKSKLPEPPPPSLKVRRATVASIESLGEGHRKGSLFMPPVQRGKKHGVINIHTCPTLNEFSDRGWMYQDRLAARCRYIRAPQTPIPPIQEVFDNRPKGDVGDQHVFRSIRHSMFSHASLCSSPFGYLNWHFINTDKFTSIFKIDNKIKELP
ncbi:predicted protein [Nematostella vectensis]|uniref:Uncharacterized protein n=1 Tax=Nematostella vectensis TaxID=45351 RepID=A7SC43_NEMVE|nr:predicted protein [Nematostella vectensis]|eukprot:XP_001630807.1 predicted protein [Nematostella vectensis]